MLRTLGNIIGFTVHATDGAIGKVYDFFFDDHSWAVRYLVVETGDWLGCGRVLISTSALGRPEWQGRSFPIVLTKEQVRTSPNVDTEKPVSRQNEIAMNVHYGWSSRVLPLGAPVAEGNADASENEEAAGDPHLRSLRVVSHYRLQNDGQQIGFVDDFIVDDEQWILRYLVIATGSHWPRLRVLIGPEWVTEISWTGGEVRVGITQADLGSSPEFDPAAAVNREYEIRLFDYYGRPRYWEMT